MEITERPTRPCGAHGYMDVVLQGQSLTAPECSPFSNVKNIRASDSLSVLATATAMPLRGRMSPWNLISLHGHLSQTRCSRRRRSVVGRGRFGRRETAGGQLKLPAASRFLQGPQHAELLPAETVSCAGSFADTYDRRSDAQAAGPGTVPADNTTPRVPAAPPRSGGAGGPATQRTRQPGPCGGVCAPFHVTRTACGDTHGRRRGSRTRTCDVQRRPHGPLPPRPRSCPLFTGSPSRSRSLTLTHGLGPRCRLPAHVGLGVMPSAPGVSVFPGPRGTRSG